MRATISDRGRFTAAESLASPVLLLRPAPIPTAADLNGAEGILKTHAVRRPGVRRVLYGRIR